MDNPPCTTNLAEAIAIMARLRAPEGCPWDLEQTFDSIKRHTLEEVYEVFDAIDRRAWSELKDELGDLLLQVLFYAQMADEAGYFAIEDVAAALNAKLIRRHPHIFADAQAATAADVNRNWQAIKQQERAELLNGADAPARRFMDDVPTHLPAMLEATKLGTRAATIGFDWPDVDGLFAKLNEEMVELKAELAAFKPEPAELKAEPAELKAAPAELTVEPAEAAKDRSRVEDELGDLLFTAVHLARHLKIEPEFALKKANAKFRRRFNAMEGTPGGLEALQQADADGLDTRWRAAKTAEAGG